MQFVIQFQDTSLFHGPDDDALLADAIRYPSLKDAYQEAQWLEFDTKIWLLRENGELAVSINLEEILKTIG